MKRIFLRSAALVVILSLGAFAVIQAQRHADRPAVASEPVAPSQLPAGPASPLPLNPATNAGLPAASGGDSFAQIYGGYTNGSAAQATAGQAAYNPTRDGQTATNPNDRYGSGYTAVASAASASGPNGSAESAAAEATLPPDVRAANDPAAGQTAAAPPPSAWPPTDLGMPTMGRGDPLDTATVREMPDPRSDGRYVNPYRNSRDSSSGPNNDRYAAAAEAAPPASAGPAIGAGVGPIAGSTSASREPAALHPDPFAQPSGMPRLGVGPNDGPSSTSVAQGGPHDDVFAMPDETAPAANSSGDSPSVAGAPEPFAPDRGALGSIAMAGSPNPADRGDGSEGAARPGGPHLEGPQAPQLTIEKLVPPEVQVGKPAVFRITVRNTGPSPAVGVEVHDPIPHGTRVVDTSPRAARGVHGDLVWTLGTLKPGESITVESQLMPTAEGEIGSVASVIFGADVSAKTIATRPQLVIETAAPDHILIGEEALLQITVSNPGTGVATGVVLEEHLPPGLQHAAGAELEYEVGDLRPGESRKLDLPLTALQAGAATNVLFARGEGGLQAEDRRTIEVTAPQLDVALDGPKKRYLEREAVYQLAVTNPGTAPAEKVDLVAYLPSGLKFVSANNAGYYDEANRAVHWRLEELPTKQTGTVELTTMPVEIGSHTIRLRGTAEKGLVVDRSQDVSVEGLAAILFQAVDSVDPVEVGGETTYDIRVLNQGSKEATNVRLAVLLPPEMRPLAADGPTRNAIEGSRVVFDGLARLAPKAETTYHVRVQGVAPGDLRARIQLLTDEMQAPVTKEESTRVYADE